MIEIEGLTKTFGEVRAVNDLSLSVPEGTTVGFLGPNGAGKTTTIKILTNLITATSGRAMLNGVDVLTQPKKALGYVGAVVETPEFYPYLTPDETLAYIGSLRGMSPSALKRRSGEVLEQVKLEQWRSTRVGKFSKGMKQRLAIAQALLHEPKILILDEPTSGLDPRGMVEVREIVKDLKKQGYTIFMSSHLLNEVQEVCDSAAMIDHGKLLVYDSIDTLKTLAKATKLEVTTVHPVTPDLISRVGGLKDVRNVEKVNGKVFLVTYAGPADARAGLLTSILGFGAAVTGFSPVGLPLETLYMDMVKETR